MSKRVQRLNQKGLAILLILSLVVIPLFLGIPQSVQAANGIQNPGFESDLVGWTSYGSGTLTSVSSPVHSGSKAVRIDNRSNIWSGPQQDIKDILLHNGQGEYMYEAMLRTASDTQNMSLKIRLTDDAGTRHLASTSTSIDSSQYTKVSKTTDITWTGTLSEAIIYTESTNPEQTGDYYVDDVSLMRSDITPTTWYSKSDFSAVFNLGSGNTGIQVIEFDVTPLFDEIDGVIGYADSSTPITGYSVPAMMIRMNMAGNFDVRNGGGYEALTNVPYSANTIYHVKMIADLHVGTYDVYVTPDGGTETMIADEYEIRHASTTDDLGHIVLISSTGEDQFKIENHPYSEYTTPTPDAWYSKSDFTAVFNLGSSNTGIQVVEFDVSPLFNDIDGVIGYADSSTPITDYSSPAILIRMNSDGNFDVRNGAVYEALTNVPYSANTMYHVKMIADLNAGTYDVYVTPDGGTETKIAEEYEIRYSSTTNDLGQIVLISTEEDEFKIENHTVYEDTTQIPGGEIVRTGDWETGDSSQWDYFSGRSQEEQFEIVASNVRQGTYAAKFTVSEGDQQPGVGGDRSEFNFPKDGIYDEKMGDTYYYGWSTMFPTDWQEPKDWGIILQFHANNGISPPLALDARGNSLNLRVQSGNIDNWYPSSYDATHTVLSDLNKGQWNDFIMKVNWEAAATGSVEIWHRTGTDEFTSVLQVNDIPTLQWSTQESKFTAGKALPWGDDWYSSTYLKLGLYRAEDTKTNILYHDSFTQGTTYSAVRAGFGLPDNADGQLDYIGDWETGNDEQFGYYTGNKKLEQTAIVTTPVRQGQYAAKFVVRPGDIQPGVPGGERSEYVVPVPSTEKLGDSYYYGWSTFFPADWTEPADWGVIMNWHAANSLSSPVSIHVRGDKLEAVFHSGSVDNWVEDGWPPEYYARHTILSDLNKGQWNDFIIKVDWEADWTGNVEVWHRTGDHPFASVLQVNNVPTLQWSTQKDSFYADRVFAWGDNWYSDGIMKLGLYRGPDTKTDYLYHDNISRGTTYSAVSERFDILRVNKVEDEGALITPPTTGPDPKDTAITTTQAVYGTPVIDGERDTLWESAASFEVKETLVGNDPATAKVWTMWDEQQVYVYAEVMDNNLSAVNETDWEQDSIEFGIDEVNDGTASSYDYGVDGGQYRVNYQNKRTVHPNQVIGSFTQSATTIVEGGYIVEAAFPIYSLELAEGMTIGFDAMINDDQGGGRTQAVSGWSVNSLNLSDRPLGLGDLELVSVISESVAAPELAASVSVGNAVGTSRVTGVAGNGNHLAILLSPVTIAVPWVGEDMPTGTGVTNPYTSSSDISGVSAGMYMGIYELDSNNKVVSFKQLHLLANHIKSTPPVSPMIKQPVVSTNGKLQVPAGGQGTVSLEDIITIDIPAGSTKESLQLTVEKLLNTDNLIKDEAKVVSPVFEILKNFSGNFMKPITLTFKFDPDRVQENQTVAVFYYDELLKEWVKIGGTLSGDQISVDIDHFTKFAVFIDKLEVDFSDISGHWAESAIKQAVSIGIVNGYADATFKPNQQLTRAEFVVMLMRGLKLEIQPLDVPFTDALKIGKWAEQAVAQSVQAGIITGYTDHTFRPDAVITRVEMAVMAARALKLTLDEDATAEFADHQDIPDWGKKEVAAVEQKGIIMGQLNSQFNPNGQATRAEALTVILRLVKSEMKEEVVSNE